MTTVENNTDLGEFVEETTQTFAEFFNSITPRTLVTTSGSSSYRWVYYGNVRNDKGEYVFRILSERWADVVDYSQAEAEQENNGLVSTGELLDENHFRAMQLLTTARNAEKGYAKSVEALGDKYDKVLADFKIVNDKLCEFAVEKGYCPEFEEVIGQWNEELSELELLGRLRQIDVHVSLGDDGPQFWLPINARSESQARKEVSNMTTTQIIRKLLDNGCYFDDLKFHVQGSEEDN